MSQWLEKEECYFSDICIEECGGKCCAPWWGIVSYPIRIEGPLAGRDKTLISKFSNDIRAREERIKANYITNETPPRPLFDTPERYNVAIESIKVSGRSIDISIRAMYAFKCLFLSDENSCAIHPAILGGEDIRPPHCGYMGTLGANYGEKGFCRIIHAAKNADLNSSVDSKDVREAIELETKSSAVFFDSGVRSVEEAADSLLTAIKQYCRKEAPELLEAAIPVKKIGRNDPCYCGSGKKYKKCHAAH